MAMLREFNFKLLLLGDAGVGKTCLMFRFTDDTFYSAYVSTVGIDFKSRTIDLDGKQVRFQIWDTAGQERFRTLSAAYYRGAMGVMLVYDVTSETSFDNIENWIRCIEENASPDIQKIIVGNKCDLNEERKITKEMGEELAKRYNVPFVETSAKTGSNVEVSFLSLARAIRSKTSSLGEGGSSRAPTQLSQGGIQLRGDNPGTDPHKNSKTCCG